MGELLIRRRELILPGESPTPTPFPPEPTLPSGYERVEYVQRPSGLSNTRGFLKCGPYVPDSSSAIRIVMDFSIDGLKDSSATSYILAAGQKTTDNTIGFGISSQVGSSFANINAYAGIAAAISPNGGNSILGERYLVDITRTPTSVSITDGTNSNSASGTARGIARIFVLFGAYRYNSDEVQYATFGKVWRLAVWENGVLTLNIVPCRETTGNKRYGLHDGVSGYTGMSGYTTGGPPV